MAEIISENSEEQKNQPLLTGENYSQELNEAEKLLESDDHEANEHVDFGNLTKSEIIVQAESTLHLPDSKKAGMILKGLKETLENLEAQELPTLIKLWTEAGNDPRDFRPTQDDSRISFNQIYQKFKDKREEERNRAEQEKQSNLKRKEAVLDKIRTLVESEENESSVKEMRELMREWKEIRHVPKEFQDELFTRYKFHIEKFYDNLGIFNELKDLDREKNLESKIDLIKKVEELKDEKNIRKALITLNKYHEDWKNIGPVRKEISEEIWQRFKGISDQIISDKRAIREKLERIKENNLNMKKLLVEKAQASIAVLPEKLKDWNAMAKELDSLMDEWKLIGPVPSAFNQEIWDNFRKVRNDFYASRKEYFAGMNASREDNLAKKTALCARAETIKDNEDFNSTTDLFNKLQDEWKKTGPVPDKHNDIIWKRFRAAFDHFYARKNAFFEQRRAQETDAVKIREAIIIEMEGFQSIENPNEVFAKLKDAQGRWAKAGFVSGKNYVNLQKRYQTLSDALFAKFKRNSDDMRQNVMKDHYDTLKGTPEGKQKLQFEERKIKEKINRFKDELATIENNMSFFAMAKNASTIKKQFEDNIIKLKVQIEKLEKELKTIRSFK